MWVITETFREDGVGEAAVTPLNWINSDAGVLMWPRDFSKKALESKMNSCEEPSKKWKKFSHFTILEEGKQFSKFEKCVFISN